MTSIKLKKIYLMGFGSWLNDQPLSSHESRSRTRFVESLQEGLKQFEADRTALIGEAVVKEEDGKTWKKKPPVENSAEMWDIPEDKIPELNKKLLDLQNENWVYNITESNKEIIKDIKHIVLDSNYLFGPREGEPEGLSGQRLRQMNDYVVWCEPFENLDLS